MKLNWFQIYDFKSIEDSGKCYLASDITILAGKNESGKTNIIECLSKMSLGSEFLEEDKPLHKLDSTPEIKAYFSLSKKEAEEIENFLNEAGMKSKKLEGLLVTITKKFPKEYSLAGDLEEYLDKLLEENFELSARELGNILKELDNLFKSYQIEIPPLSINVRELYKSGFSAEIKRIISETKSNVDKIPEDNRSRVDELVGKMESINSKLNDILSIKDKIKNIILDNLPNIILFSSFSDILPTEVNYDDAKNIKIVRDFCEICGLDVDKLKDNPTIQGKTNISTTHSDQFTGEFRKYWAQEPINVKIVPTETKMSFLIQREGLSQHFRPEQRSQGLKWYMSFFITLNAESKRKNNIILIDEPGLYLHAKAQEDVLKVLENLSATNQVIFTTHSPYLIDPNRLDRIRLVIRETKDDFTKIEGKIHKGASEETLTPIITAIGLNLSRSLGPVSNNNVVLEGISDYYFLKGIQKYLEQKENFKPKNEFSLIPCVGATKIPQIISLLIGWDLNHLIFLDDDSAGRKVEKELIEKLHIPSDKIVKTLHKDSALEDMFHPQDFENYVLDKKLRDKRNSEAIKDSDKVLLSKLFFDKVRGGKVEALTKETINNFKTIFSKLDSF